MAPRDPRLPGGGGYAVGGLYDLNPDKRGQVDNYVTSSDRYGGQIEHWNGVDASVDLRLNRVMVRGGVSTGRTSIDVCDVAAQVPETLGTVGAIGTRPTPWSLDQCHVDTNFLTQIKLMGTYAVPRIDVQVAATFQSTPGPEIQANYVAPSAAAEPSLGRQLSGGANTTVTLIDPGTVNGARLAQLDLRVSKRLGFGRARAALNVDLYNALNANPVTAVNLNYAGTGAAWLQPQGILPARLFKLSVQFDY
jgi:hypothetical protein